VTITSPDPRVRPAINFRYFEEGTDAGGDDLQAVVDGIGLVRRMTAGMKPALVSHEEVPGDDVQGDKALKEFVRNHAWGHHASCTCKIGRDDDPMAVLDGSFRVRGAQNLRVVDASVFPRIPGYFIVTPTYMISEKASDAVLADAGVPVTVPA